MNGWKINFRNALVCAVAMLTVLGAAVNAFAVETQFISLQADPPGSKPTSVGQGLKVLINYDAYDTDTPDVSVSSGGIAMRVFYDSTKVTYQFYDSLASSQVTEAPSDHEDTNNLDGDEVTDRFIQVSWAEYDSPNWPSGSLPQSLAGLYFVVASVESTYMNANVFQYSLSAAQATGLDWDPPVITIDGDNPLQLELNEDFVDPGATATDNNDGTFAATRLSDNIDITTIGLYEVVYTAFDSSGNEAEHVIRQVRVGHDTEPPVITIDSENPVDIPLDSSFTIPTATAVDAVDGELEVSIVGTVDTSVETSYQIYYRAVDMSENWATETLVVNVIDYPEPVITFTATPDTITIGGTTTLDWTTTYADTVEITPDIGTAVGTEGTWDVEPQQTTTYTLVASGLGGDTIAEVTVTVIRPPVVNFSANPATIESGEKSTLNWSTEETETVEIDQGIGSVDPLQGTYDVYPTETTTYTITATGPGGTATATAIVTVIAQPSASINASRTIIERGESSQLTWSVANAESVSIMPGGQVDPGGGPLDVLPQTTTTYIITAVGYAGGEATDQVTIVVVDPMTPSVNINADPENRRPGDAPTILSWTSVNLTELTISPGIGSVAESGNYEVSPAETTTYTIEGTGQYGSASDTVTVYVNTQPLPAITYFDADPAIVGTGGTTTLSWGVTNADAVVITPSVGSDLQVEGTATTTVAETTTFTITATGPGGEVSAQTTVLVDTGQVAVSIDANPGRITLGNPATLSWSSANATSVSISPPGSTVDPVGFMSVSPTTTTTYTITATGSGQPATAQVTIIVDVPPSIDFSANPTTIQPGGTSTLSWSVANATDVSISPGPGSVAGEGSWDATPTETTAYTLTATGAGGTSTAQVTVIVNTGQVEVSLDANPQTITSGDSSTLSWTAANATAVAISPGIGSVDTDGGSMEVFPTSTTIYTITATASGGQTASAQATVTVEDEDPPTATLTANPTSIQEGGSSTLSWSVTNADTVSISPGIGSVDPESSTEVSPTSTTTYTLTAVGPGGTTTRQATVLVTSDPNEVQVSITASPASLSPGGGTSTLTWSSTNADTVSISPGLTGLTTNGNIDVTITETTTYTITATGATGSATDQVTIYVSQPSPPTIMINGNNPVTIFVGSAYNDAGARAGDAVDGQIGYTADSNVDPNQVGNYSVVYTATNSFGLTATATRIVYVVDAPSDTTPPEITILGSNPQTVFVGSGYTDAGATAMDDTDGDITSSIATTGSVNTSVANTYSITYSVSDSAGNYAQAVRTVQVVSTDTVPPVITLIGENPVTIAAGSSYSDAGATASDNIDGNITGNIITTNNVNSSEVGVYTVEYSVSDSSGNSARASRVVTVVSGADTVAPTITILGNNPQAVLVGNPYTDAGATANDDIDGDITWKIQTLNAVDHNSVGIYTVTYIVSDNAGNQAQVWRTVTVVEADLVPPVIEILGENPTNVLVGSAYADSGATAEDDIDGDISGGIITVNNVNTGAEGTYTVEYYVTDSSGNPARATRTVYVVTRDMTPPVITVIGDNPATVLTGQTYFDEGATATDDIDDNAWITTRIEVQNNVNTLSPGTYNVTYSVADSAGNRAWAERFVNVVSQDRTSPVITLVGDNPVKLTVGTPYYDAGATATDDIDSDILITARIVMTSNVNTDVAGTYAVRYNVTDTSGNIAEEVVRTVTVVANDNEAPVITLVGDNPLRIQVGNTFNDPGATATDDIDDDVFITAYINVAGYVDTNRAGTYYLAYNVSDTAGNAAAEVVRVVDVYESQGQPGQPSRPVPMSPANGNFGVESPYELTVGTPSDPDANSWTVVWQIATDQNFADLVLNRWNNSWTLEVPHYVIQDGAGEYFWRVAFVNQDGVQSEWSDTYSFTTVNVSPRDTDSNGTPDNLEVRDPEIDLDGDGTIDIAQDDMFVVHTVTGTVMGAKGSPNTTILSITSFDPESLSENGMAEMSEGIISLRIEADYTGATAEVTVWFDEPAPGNARMYYYDTVTGEWYEYGSDDYTFSDDRGSVVVRITDGGPYDADGLANAIVIMKPSAYGTPKEGGGGGETPSGGESDDDDDDDSNCFVSTLENSGSPPMFFVVIFSAIAICVIHVRLKRKHDNMH